MARDMDGPGVGSRQIGHVGRGERRRGRGADPGRRAAALVARLARHELAGARLRPPPDGGPVGGARGGRV